jgi:undecaprenyl diphosphate synthase
MSQEIDPDRLPEHVAIIMDGNGRWAAKKGQPRQAGHSAGEAALFDTVEGALALGLRHLTVYAFSTENWRRPPAEVRFLMGFNRDLLLRRADELDERRVKVRFIGRRGLPVPRSLVKLIEQTEERTAHHDRLVFQIAFNYGSHQEIADAARRMIDDVAAKRLRARDVDADAIAARLYSPEAPPVDLLVRTSGEQRLSNFLLWQAAYAELVFTDVLWPEFDRGHLRAAVAEYQRRNRRFGRV